MDGVTIHIIRETSTALLRLERIYIIFNWLSDLTAPVLNLTVDQQVYLQKRFNKFPCFLN